MFDDFIKQLKKLESTGVSVPMQSDSEGYFDKECPSEACLFQFKIFGEDWTSLCKDEAIHCPLCGHQAPSKSWWTKEQIEGARKQALGVAKAAISRGLSDGARTFNRKQKPGLITMSMKFSGGPTHYTVVPVAAQEAMKLKIQCESCSTRFAVVGSAFFCPCCGFNSVERIFDDSLKKVETKLDNLETVRSTLENLADKDSAELTCRSLVETGLNDCVVAFQKLMESLYLRIPGTQKPSLNTFQRLDLRRDGQADRAFEAAQTAIVQFPKSADLHYLAASICDAYRTENEAVPFYIRALELGLNGVDRRDAFLGLASTYRSLGKYIESKQTFEKGFSEFPDYRPYQVFLALTEFNLQDAPSSIRRLLEQLIETTSDQEIRSYEKALKFYSTRQSEVFE